MAHEWGPANWTPSMHGLDHGVLHQIWHLLGRLYEGHKLHRESAELRTSDLKDHVDAKIDGIVERLDQLEATVQKHPNQSWWKDLPWHHMITLALGAYLAVQGHLSAAEWKDMIIHRLGGG